MVHGNRQPIRGVGEPLANATDSCDVAVMANDTAPGTLALGGQSRQCSFTLPVEPPAPPSVAGRGRPRAAPPAPAPPPPTTAPAPPTTASTTTEAAPSTSARSSTTDAEPLGTRLAASDTSDDDGVSVPELALAAVLTALACAGGVLAFSARRGRR
jgi:hypothetical protein